jgi:TPR repeat protein
LNQIGAARYFKPAADQGNAPANVRTELVFALVEVFGRCMLKQYRIPNSRLINPM